MARLSLLLTILLFASTRIEAFFGWSAEEDVPEFPTEYEAPSAENFFGMEGFGALSPGSSDVYGWPGQEENDNEIHTGYGGPSVENSFDVEGFGAQSPGLSGLFSWPGQGENDDDDHEIHTGYGGPTVENSFDFEGFGAQSPGLSGLFSWPGQGENDHYDHEIHTGYGGPTVENSFDSDGYGEQSPGLFHSYSWPGQGENDQHDHEIHVGYGGPIVENVFPTSEFGTSSEDTPREYWPWNEENPHVIPAAENIFPTIQVGAESSDEDSSLGFERQWPERRENIHITSPDVGYAVPEHVAITGIPTEHDKTNFFRPGVQRGPQETASVENDAEVLTDDDWDAMAKKPRRTPRVLIKRPSKPKPSTIHIETKPPTFPNHPMPPTFPNHPMPPTFPTNPMPPTFPTRPMPPTFPTHTIPSTIPTIPNPSTIPNQPKPATIPNTPKPSRIRTKPKPSTTPPPTTDTGMSEAIHDQKEYKNNFLDFEQKTKSYMENLKENLRTELSKYSRSFHEELQRYVKRLLSNTTFEITNRTRDTCDCDGTQQSPCPSKCFYSCYGSLYGTEMQYLEDCWGREFDRFTCYQKFGTVCQSPDCSRTVESCVTTTNETVPSDTVCQEYKIDIESFSKSFDTLTAVPIEPIMKRYKEIERELEYLEDTARSADRITALALLCRTMKSNWEQACAKGNAKALSSEVTKFQQIKTNVAAGLLNIELSIPDVFKSFNGVKDQHSSQLNKSLEQYACCLETFNVRAPELNCKAGLDQNVEQARLNAETLQNTD